MIRYNYTIKRDEGNEERIYKPHLIPKELADLVYIQGPNSAGKSTLLNLIALAFYGEKLREDDLNPALREKVEQLRSSDHQQLTFEIEVQNDILNTTIKSIKSDFETKDIKVVEIIDGKERIIGEDRFLKEYKLIYDIPTDPIRRLPELLKEIRSSQRTVEDEVVRLRNAINDAINGVKEGKNPDRLNELKELIEAYTQKKKKLSLVIKALEKETLWLKEFFSLKFYFNYISRLENTEKEIERITKTQLSAKNKQRRLSKKEEELIHRIKERVKKGSEIYDQVTGLLETINLRGILTRIQIWHKLNCTKEIKEPKKYTVLKEEIKYFLQYFSNLKLEEGGEVLREGEFLEGLYELLANFRHTNISVPGTNKKIDEFLDILELERRKKEGVINRSKNIANCIKLLKEFLIILEGAVSDNKEYEEFNNKYRQGALWIEQEADGQVLERLNEKKIEFEGIVAHFIKELGQLNITISDANRRYQQIISSTNYGLYNDYTETQLEEHIESRTLELAAAKQKLSVLNKEIEVATNDKEQIESKKPHKYQLYLHKLETVKKVVQQLESKFSVDFDGHIKKIMEININPKSLTKDEKDYAERVAEFLAEKLKFIKHTEGRYKLKKVDIIAKEVISTEGKRIKFLDFGTGQGQGAYLEGLLSMNDNRKVIALFDEVAMMDTSTLKPIFEKLKELYKQKKLLLGIIVQKSDKVQIDSLTFNQ